MTRRKKIVTEVEVSPVLQEIEKQVEQEVEVLEEKEKEDQAISTNIYGCFPIGYIMPDEEEIE